MDVLGYSNKEKYHCFTPEELRESIIDEIYLFVEKKMMQEQKDVVFDLQHIESIFSQHLTMFLKLFKLLDSFDLQFVLVGMTPAVLNVIQMTQLDGYLRLCMNCEEYEGLAQNDRNKGGVSFSCRVSENSIGEQIMNLDGFVSRTEQFNHCLKKLKPGKVVLDFEHVGFIDAESLIAISAMRNEHDIYIKNPSKAIIELLEEKDILDHFLIEE
ncbi:MAG: STAS domain-containing protein [Fibrobacterales bacterium]